MPVVAVLLAFLLGVAGCRDCDVAGYTPLRVFLVSGAEMPAAAVENGRESGCIVYTDLPVDTKEPDQYGAALRHIGEGIYQCLTHKTAATVSAEPGGAFYQERLWFRIDGQCQVKPNFTTYGCFDLTCRTINTEVGHIGPTSVCTRGAPMSEWTPECWTQFYAVLGHEVMHGWLGEFHK